MNDIFEKIQADFDEFMKSAKEFVEKEKAKHISQEEKKVRRWEPECGEKYYYISTVSQIYDLIWTGITEESVDYVHYKLGNCFKTKEEAQKELDRRLAEQELLDVCDWDGEEKVYAIECRYNDKWFTCSWSSYIQSPYRFASEECCQKAIDTLGTEKLKLIFRID